MTELADLCFPNRSYFVSGYRSCFRSCDGDAWDRRLSQHALQVALKAIQNKGGDCLATTKGGIDFFPSAKVRTDHDDHGDPDALLLITAQGLTCRYRRI
jgi:hypothetical protein